MGVINVTLDYDANKAMKSDDIKDTVDYKTITKKIIALVESSKFFLLEKLAAEILQIALEPALVEQASVRIDKPQALRFAKSVSVEVSRTK